MRQSVIVTAIVSAIPAATLVAELVMDHASSAALTVGALSVVAVLHVRSVRHIDRANRPADQAYELGYQMGYDRGYTEGHREARPVVVSLHHAEARTPSRG